MPGSMFDRQKLCREPAVFSTLHEGEVHFLSTDNHHPPKLPKTLLQVLFFYCVNSRTLCLPPRQNLTAVS